jgi:hypothetical protein
MQTWGGMIAGQADLLSCAIQNVVCGCKGRKPDASACRLIFSMRTLDAGEALKGHSTDLEVRRTGRGTAAPAAAPLLSVVENHYD